MGGNLQAEGTLYASDELVAVLRQLGDELRFVTITSTAAVKPLAEAPEAAVATELDGLRLQVAKSAHAKCGRCWHHRADVGGDVNHPEICARCVDNIEGDGEVRHYA